MFLLPSHRGLDERHRDGRQQADNRGRSNQFNEAETRATAIHHGHDQRTISMCCVTGKPGRPMARWLPVDVTPMTLMSATGTAASGLSTTVSTLPGPLAPVPSLPLVPTETRPPGLSITWLK